MRTWNMRRGPDRFEFVDGERWYARTREGRLGPFPERPGAESALADLIREKVPVLPERLLRLSSRKVKARATIATLVEVVRVRCVSPGYIGVPY